MQDWITRPFRSAFLLAACAVAACSQGYTPATTPGATHAGAVDGLPMLFAKQTLEDASRTLDSGETGPAAPWSAASGVTHMAVDFAAARYQTATSDFERYIDPSIAGADRATLQNIMSRLPPAFRSNFVVSLADGRLLSNTSDGVRRSLENRDAQGESVVEALQSSATCADPAHPPNCGTGPFRKIVSAGGYSAVRGYLYFPCGSSLLPKQGDAGYLFFGGNSSIASIDAGFQYSPTFDTVTIFLLDSAHNHYRPASNPGNERQVSGSMRLPCSHYLRLTFGAVSASQLSLLAEPVDSHGNPNGSSDMILETVKGSKYFTSWHTGSDSEGWSPTCACQVKRIVSVAQVKENFNNLERFAVIVSHPQPSQEVRLPVLQVVNVRKGFLPNLSTNASSFPYLGAGGDTVLVNPSSPQFSEEVLVSNYRPNPGTEYTGLYLTPCPPTFTCVIGD